MLLGRREAALSTQHFPLSTRRPAEGRGAADGTRQRAGRAGGGRCA